jgi:hypothetical protein
MLRIADDSTYMFSSTFVAASYFPRYHPINGSEVNEFSLSKSVPSPVLTWANIHVSIVI